jgi:hypothetical protein
MKLVVTRLFLVTLLSQAGCDFFNPEIHFVLPDKYVGAFRIVLDDAHGIDVQPQGGRYICTIPETGELAVKTFEPFMHWHKVTAAYRNGQAIPTEVSTTNPDVVALREGPGSGSREVNGKNVGPIVLTYVIGTAEQLKQSNLTR